jgi:Mg-chelatase subunit ChlD
MNKTTSYLKVWAKKSIALSLSALLVAYNIGINIQYLPKAILEQDQKTLSQVLEDISVKAQAAQCCSQDILLTIDRTGSMGENEKWNKTKEAVKYMLDNTDYPTVWSLISFNTNAILEKDWTRGTGDIWSKLNALTPLGMTNYAPAITLSKSQMDKRAATPNACKFAILVGDGGQNVNDPSLDATLLKNQ